VRQIRTHIPPVLRVDQADIEIRVIAKIDGVQTEIIAPINSASYFVGQVMDKLARPLIDLAEHERKADAAGSYDHAMHVKREQGVRSGAFELHNDAERRQVREGPVDNQQLDCVKFPK